MKEGKSNGYLLFYVLFFVTGVVALITGRAHAAYWGSTEGPNVRVGGILAILGGLWGLGIEWKKRKKKGSESQDENSSS